MLSWPRTMVWCNNARRAPPLITVRTLLLWLHGVGLPCGLPKVKAEKNGPVGGGEFSGHRMWVQSKCFLLGSRYCGSGHAG